MTPTGGNRAPNGFDSPTSPGEVLLRVRLNPNVPVPCPIRTEIDSCQGLVEPGSNAPKHHMILGIHRGPCSVLPEFPQLSSPPGRPYNPNSGTSSAWLSHSRHQHGQST